MFQTVTLLILINSWICFESIYNRTFSTITVPQYFNLFLNSYYSYVFSACSQTHIHSATYTIEYYWLHSFPRLMLCSHCGSRGQIKRSGPRSQQETDCKLPPQLKWAKWRQTLWTFTFFCSSIWKLGGCSYVLLWINLYYLISPLRWSSAVVIDHQGL